MSTLRQAAQQALEALENPDGLDEYNRSISDNAITALQAALAEPEQKVWCDCGDSIEPDSGAKCGNCVAGDSAEPEQEPVKWHHPECEGACIACLIERAVQEEYGSQGLAYLQRHLVSQPQPEPLGWITAGQHTAPLRTHWEGCEAVHPECRKPEQEPVAWVPVTEALPESGVKVLACYRNRFGNLCRIRAKWIAAKTDEAYGEGAEFCSEYDEATDTYYTTEGWYECINNWDEFTSIAVTEGDVTHWMPLPPDPDTAPTPRKPLTDEEIWKCLPPDPDELAFARAIERAHGIKENI